MEPQQVEPVAGQAGQPEQPSSRKKRAKSTKTPKKPAAPKAPKSRCGFSLLNYPEPIYRPPRCEWPPHRSTHIYAIYKAELATRDAVPEPDTGIFCTTHMAYLREAWRNDAPLMQNIFNDPALGPVFVSDMRWLAPPVHEWKINSLGQRVDMTAMREKNLCQKYLMQGLSQGTLDVIINQGRDQLPAESLQDMAQMFEAFYDVYRVLDRLFRELDGDYPHTHPPWVPEMPAPDAPVPEVPRRAHPGIQYRLESVVRMGKTREAGLARHALLRRLYALGYTRAQIGSSIVRVRMSFPHLRGVPRMNERRDDEEYEALLMMEMKMRMKLGLKPYMLEEDVFRNVLYCAPPLPLSDPLDEKAMADDIAADLAAPLTPVVDDDALEEPDDAERTNTACTTSPVDNTNNTNSNGAPLDSAAGTPRSPARTNPFDDVDAAPFAAFVDESLVSNDDPLESSAPLRFEDEMVEEQAPAIITGDDAVRDEPVEEMIPDALYLPETPNAISGEFECTKCGLFKPDIGFPRAYKIQNNEKRAYRRKVCHSCVYQRKKDVKK